MRRRHNKHHQLLIVWTPDSIVKTLATIISCHSPSIKMNASMCSLVANHATSNVSTGLASRVGCRRVTRVPWPRRGTSIVARSPLQPRIGWIQGQECSARETKRWNHTQADPHKTGLNTASNTRTRPARHESEATRMCLWCGQEGRNPAH